MRSFSAPVSSCIAGFVLSSPPPRRCFSSLVQRLGTAVARRLSDVADAHVLPLAEQSLTERRRPYPRRSSMPESLSERLQLQRRLRTRLVPSQLIVSRDGLYLELVWPAAALRAAEEQYAREASASAPAPAPALSPAADSAPAPAADSAPAPSPAAAPSHASGAASTAQQRRLGAHRTRLLAEFLRAYSPSTDVIGADALIYGRRGIKISDVFPVGNYALRIVFSDGHSGGVYPYEYLFHLGVHKYAMMREYIQRLKEKRKSREPPRRVPSQRLRERRTVSG